ncbi:cryptochrome dash-like [Limosa lapponica baueri]|uniref:Cryptochrome dash-like n=1 Tax=Limosa lapponica baueri TaxID=1758121 RepID=A0A2I0THH6_LIMLA|nr:cryptochrome dash-like [Limosa lapponica baueri]
MFVHTLVVRKGKPEDVVRDLITQLGSVSAVAFHEEATQEELDVEKGLCQVCSQHGVKIQTFWASTLYHRDDLPFRPISRVLFELLWRDYFRFVALKYGKRIFSLRGVYGSLYLEKKDISGKQQHNKSKDAVSGDTPPLERIQASGLPRFTGESGTEQKPTQQCESQDTRYSFCLCGSFGCPVASEVALDASGGPKLRCLEVDYDVCSNYGNWLYSAGVGNDPRDNRKFNMIKQGLDYDGNGDYVRLWVPELQGIKGADIHTPWALNGAALSQAGVTLGETYPQPVVTAPEWSRHINQRPV